MHIKEGLSNGIIEVYPGFSIAEKISRKALEIVEGFYDMKGGVKNPGIRKEL